MLPGTLYPKKTYGRSLFVGEFKHAVVPVVSESTNPTSQATAGPKNDEIGKGGELPSEGGSEAVKVSQKTLTYAEDEGGIKVVREEDLKVIWKKTEAPLAPAPKPKKGPAAKAFFTPSPELSKEEEQTPTASAVPTSPREETEPGESSKFARKKRLQIPARRNLPPRQINFPLKNRTATLKTKGGSRPTSASSAASVSEKAAKEEKEEGEPIEEERSEDGKEKRQSERVEVEAEQETAVKVKDTSISQKVSESEQSVEKQPLEVPESVESEHESLEAPEREDEEVPKSIIIKPLDLAGYAQRVEVEAEESLGVLEPDAVADLKRDLAQKGIIVLPPSQLIDEPSVSIAEDDTITINEDSTVYDDLDDKDGFIADDQTEILSDKLEKKEGFKTNKSFEIRRLQAKAEREREKKRAVFGSRFPKLRMKSESPAAISKNGPYDAEQKMVPLKSSLKPATPPRDSENGKMNAPSPGGGKMRASVRIRDPEFDYEEYTDVELDSIDSNMPNSGLTYSDLDESSVISSGSSTFSTTTYNDSPNDSISMSDGESSLRGSALHRLYDELDNLTPSRQDAYPEGTNREIDSRDSKRTRSSMSRVTRSSLHLPLQRLQPNRLVEDYMEAYQERPMHLFDAMRHERQGSREERRKRDRRRVSALQEEPSKKERRPRPPPGKPQKMGMAFGPMIIPIEPRAGGYTRRQWRGRVDKFFETSYANRDRTKSRKNPENYRSGTVEQEADMAGTCACCRTRCRPVYDLLDCSKKSALSHLLWLAIPTLAITCLVLVLILFAADIVPFQVAEMAQENSTAAILNATSLEGQTT